MIKGHFEHVKDIKQFYKEIREVQETAHGEGYCDLHDEIIKKSTECETYRELGTMQGATAACAVVAGYTKLQLVDLDFEQFRPYKHLFDGHDVEMYECDSKDPKLTTIGNVDLMVIDSYHKGYHTWEELKVHAPYVNRYILFHDTFKPSDSVQQAVNQFVMQNANWHIETYSKVNVGYTCIKRDR